jgi:hypothetical protein
MRLDGTGCHTNKSFDHLHEWNQFWGVEETGSQMAKAQFVCGGLEGRYTNCNMPERVITGEVRLHPDSPGKGAGIDGRDLGADVDFVGAGVAYEKWMSTKEHEGWRSQSDALVANASAPFLPLFNGADLTGWLGDVDSWRVDHQAMVVSAQESYLRTRRRDFKNFELRFEHQVTAIDARIRRSRPGQTPGRGAVYGRWYRLLRPHRRQAADGVDL